jgi:endonuclease-8
MVGVVASAGPTMPWRIVWAAMPEGDTVARIAVLLRGALVGKRVVGLTSRLPALRDTMLEGHAVTGIHTRGKHLLVSFDDGRTLHTHLRMSGTWRLLTRTSPRAASSAVVAIETDDLIAVLLQRSRGAPPIVRLLSADALRRQPMLRALGPDLLDPAFDLEAAVRRLGATSHRTVGEALLDQRLVAGIGNEYKSEVCFIRHIHPHAKPETLEKDTWRSLLSCAHELMHVNVRRGTRGRVTRFASGSRMWVYGRRGEQCLRCKMGIVQRSFDGLDRRMTFWCPECQPD